MVVLHFNGVIFVSAGVSLFVVSINIAWGGTFRWAWGVMGSWSSWLVYWCCGWGWCWDWDWGCGWGWGLELQFGIRKISSKIFLSEIYGTNAGSLQNPAWSLSLVPIKIISVFSVPLSNHIHTLVLQSSVTRSATEVVAFNSQLTTKTTKSWMLKSKTAI